VNDEVRKIIGNIDGLNEMWSTLDKCCKGPEKYISQALGPVIEFRKYTMARQCSYQRILLSAQGCNQRGARAVGHKKLLINKQTLLGIMGKVSPTD
jgi:hypothetical protein